MAILIERYIEVELDLSNYWFLSVNEIKWKHLSQHKWVSQRIQELYTFMQNDLNNLMKESSIGSIVIKKTS